MPPDMSKIDPRVLAVYSSLKRFKDDPKRTKWKKLRKRSWDAYENEMYSGEEKAELREEGQIPLVINKIVKGVQGSSAVVTDQKPEVKFNPIGSTDLYVAELVKRGHDFVWDKNEGSDVSYEIVEESKIGGIGFFYILFNKNKGIFGRIEFENLDPEDVYWSSTSRKRDLSDTDVIIARLRTKKYLQDRYDITDEDLEIDFTIPSEVQKTYGVTGKDNYLEVQEDRLETDDPDNKRKERTLFWEIDAWMLRTIKESSALSLDGTGKVKRERIKEDEFEESEKTGKRPFTKLIERRVQRIIVGTKLVKEEIDPYGSDSDGDPILPIIPLPHTKTRTAYPMSPTNYAIDLNKEKNKRRAQFIQAASHGVNAPIIEPENMLKFDKSPSKPGARGQLDVNAPFQPYRLTGGSLEISRFADLESRSDSDIDDQYDMHDVMRGKIPKGTDPSGRVVLALQDMGGMMSKPFLRKFERCIVSVGKVDAVLMLRFWPPQMWERLIEADELNDPTVVDEDTGQTQGERWKEALVIISNNGLSVLNFDIRVTAGSSAPTNRMAKSLLAIEYVQNGIYDPEAALDYVDDPNKEKIVARLKEREGVALQQKGG